MTKRCKVCGKSIKRWVRGLFDDRHGYPGKFDVYRCSNCGFGQSEPQLKKKEISKVYGDYYPRQELNLKNINEKDFKIPARSLLERKGLMINGQYWVKPKTRVLDVGCGLGYSLLELKNFGCEAYGIDPDPNTKKFANKFRLKFHEGFIEDDPFREVQFDYIIANQVLEHTNDPVKFLRTCKKRLKPGGELIFAFPNVDSLSRKILKKSWLHWHIPYHLNFFNRESVETISNMAGLKVKKIMTITPNMWTNLQLRRLLQRPKIGQRDGFWDGGKSVNDGIGSSWLSVLLSKFWVLLEEHNYLNRVIDVFGEGDSFVVIWKKD